jgi:hypothetical protein
MGLESAAMLLVSGRLIESGGSVQDVLELVAIHPRRLRQRFSWVTRHHFRKGSKYARRL